MGWICGKCGEGLPEGETCPCSMVDDDDYEYLEPQKLTRWSGLTLEEAMLCQGCHSEVKWATAPRYTWGFLCPHCGRRRPQRRARPNVRNQAGERDGWICHRCELPIDRSVVWPHPLAGVGDHYPVNSDNGGPAILSNIKISHSLCNGSSDIYVQSVRPNFPDTAANRRPPEVLKPGEPTLAYTAEQQKLIDSLLVLAEKENWFPLRPSSERITVPPEPPRQAGEPPSDQAGGLSVS